MFWSDVPSSCNVRCQAIIVNQMGMFTFLWCCCLVFPAIENDPVKLVDNTYHSRVFLLMQQSSVILNSQERSFKTSLMAINHKHFPFTLI